MSEVHQYELSLVKPTGRQAFDKWRHTPIGGEITNKAIRLSVGIRKRGFKRYSIRAIIHRLRWHYSMKHGPEKQNEYLINNNMTPHLARFIMERVPELAGDDNNPPFFETRELGQRKKNRAVVVPIKKKEA